MLPLRMQSRHGTGGQTMTEYTNKENCAECIYHDIFWKGSGCNLLNNMEQCKFKQKNQTSLGEIIDAAD